MGAAECEEDRGFGGRLAKRALADEVEIDSWREQETFHNIQLEDRNGIGRNWTSRVFDDGRTSRDEKGGKEQDGREQELGRDEKLVQVFGPKPNFAPRGVWNSENIRLSVGHLALADLGPGLARGPSGHGLDLFVEACLKNEVERPRVEKIMKRVFADDVKRNDDDHDICETTDERSQVAHDSWPFPSGIKVSNDEVVGEDLGTKLSQNRMDWCGRRLICWCGLDLVGRRAEVDGSGWLEEWAGDLDGRGTIIWVGRLRPNGIWIGGSLLFGVATKTWKRLGKVSIMLSERRQAVLLAMFNFEMLE